MRTSSWYWQLQKRLSTAARLLNQHSWIHLKCSSRQLQHGSIVCSQASLSPLGHCLHHTRLQANKRAEQQLRDTTPQVAETAMIAVLPKISRQSSHQQGC